MGGTVAVVLRKLDGSLVKMARWTNAMPDWICSKDLIETPEKWERDFIESWELGDREPAHVAPLAYGLIAIDLPGKVVLSCNDYSKPNSAWYYGENFRRPKEDFQWLLEQGRIKRVQETQASAGRFEFEWQEALTSSESFERDVKAFVDLNPYTVVHFLANREGFSAMRDRVSQSFTLTPEDEAAWHEFLVDRYGATA